MKQRTGKQQKIELVLQKKINQIGKPLSRLTKEKKRVQVNKIINERGDITTDKTEIQRIISDYCEQS